MGEDIWNRKESRVPALQKCAHALLTGKEGKSEGLVDISIAVQAEARLKGIIGGAGELQLGTDGLICSELGGILLQLEEGERVGVSYRRLTRSILRFFNSSMRVLFLSEEFWASYFLFLFFFFFCNCFSLDYIRNLKKK
ncbi:hypothetical protein I7I48_04619 [Histoplasma ohiense]|nr:hypothetical protein I7I48_04619 [Histoplasma ohiense (nom. inval.)]